MSGQNYEDKLSYKITTDQSDLDKITASVANAAAKGMAQAVGFSASGGSASQAMANIRAHLTGSKGATATGGAPGGAAIGSMASIRFARSVSQFGAAVNKFAKMGISGGVASSAAKATGDMFGPGRKEAEKSWAAELKRLKGLAGGANGGGHGQMLGMLLRSAFPRAFGSGSMGGHLLEMAQRTGAINNIGSVVSGAGGSGSSVMGSVGSAIATRAGPYAIIAAEVIRLWKTFTAAMGHASDAIHNWSRSLISGNMSTAIHGFIDHAHLFSTGISMALGPLGIVTKFFGDKFFGALHQAVDGLDNLVAGLGKFSPIVAAQASILEVKTMMFNRKMADAMQPLMSSWISIKSGFLDVASSIVGLIAPALRAFGNAVQDVVNFIKGIFSLPSDDMTIRQANKNYAHQHFASGGPVLPNFKPRGTDTVPAMLTPGEFVMNSKASRAFGPQLRAMNYLAFGGNVQSGFQSFASGVQGNFHNQFNKPIMGPSGDSGGGGLLPQGQLPHDGSGKGPWGYMDRKTDAHGYMYHQSIGSSQKMDGMQLHDALLKVPLLGSMIAARDDSFDMGGGGANAGGAAGKMGGGMGVVRPGGMARGSNSSDAPPRPKETGTPSSPDRDWILKLLNKESEKLADEFGGFQHESNRAACQGGMVNPISMYL